MFEAAELGRKVSKDDFNKLEPEVRTQLLAAQRKLRESNVSVMIIVSGVEGAGKGEVVNMLNEWLDTRGLQTHAFWDEQEEERQHPRYWRFWRAMPPRGGIGILFGAWYNQPIIDLLGKRRDEDYLDSEATQINDLERMLIHDNMLILKFWFHLPKGEQKARLKKLSKDPHSRWRMAPQTTKRSKAYDNFVRVSERLVRQTDSGASPWYMIESTDRRYRDLTVARTIVEAIEGKLASEHIDQPTTIPHSPRLPTVPSARVTALDHVDLGQKLEPSDYKKQLKEYQTRLNTLSWRAFNQDRAVVMVFEGWDAAGKGGAIRRLMAAIDARLHRVIPIAAPTDEERAHHYLWRFWRHTPGPGRFTVFDRSWYGRVLVERVEGFATEAAWKRSYLEINEPGSRYFCESLFWASSPSKQQKLHATVYACGARQSCVRCVITSSRLYTTPSVTLRRHKAAAASSPSFARALNYE
ncbi:polyphosphate:AMP phosphotransferase [Candidatus Reidiella endopervernicosa]|uniref:Polyphosphate:AMP phosphotransferase n=1 Tax=Candidatus Reidiella endopervernicosa TaxID=2738883 RepID=A0A6N0HZZ3_9GAMM|nr:polyphosphate:AMP phosphotransferase [Candidatus Reidiella endopervernicosa]QKQ27889.1 polyphosphate:AMP phosphotransferase [Candidatus Reidiella endopervernicosa]